MSNVIARHRGLFAIGIYAGVTAIAYLGAWLLRFEAELPEGTFQVIRNTLFLLILIRLGSSRLFRLTLGRWRFVSTGDVRRLLAASTSGTLLFYGILTVVPGLGTVPRSIYLIEWALTVLLTAGIWLVYRTGYEYRKRARGSGPETERRVILVGAGEAGNLLAREMLRSSTGHRVVAFVDDDPLKVGTILQGVTVEGTTSDLERVANDSAADEIVLAIPSATPERVREIVSSCEAVEIPIKVLPGIQDVIEGEVRLSQIRPLQIEDLLGREPIRLDLPELAADLRGRVALVSGAAGSIGSELCRQIAANRPHTLIAFDQAESDLFFVEQELRDRYPALNLVCIVGSILDEPLVSAVFDRYRPDRVYHAAAYKHVPLMEENQRAAVLNNVLGTWRMAAAAGVSGTEKFVLISTDKAVLPSSVMGSTKRLAEVVVTSCQQRFPSTMFTAVRFGNVLGSNGSVVPIFQRQIAEGRPITVTHPEVTRYFMTIAEAVQLVLQASLLDEASGRVTMLDMGEPVKIVELARKMLRLSGMRSGEIPIVFTGLRPGEKLHEELAGPGEECESSRNPKVTLLTHASIPAGALSLDALVEWCGEWSDPADPSTESYRRELDRWVQLASSTARVGDPVGDPATGSWGRA
jgi:FlaA1/EpsC-like NDP-sugar epimerase